MLHNCDQAFQSPCSENSNILNTLERVLFKFHLHIQVYDTQNTTKNSPELIPSRVLKELLNDFHYDIFSYIFLEVTNITSFEFSVVSEKLAAIIHLTPFSSQYSISLSRHLRSSQLEQTSVQRLTN